MTIQRQGYSTLVQDILHQLEADILAGVLRPGEHLDEQRLAERFGASRTPIRESLRYLTAANLVEVRPRRGAVVAKISIPRMIQMFEVMSVLEGLCARLAARRMTAEERESLRKLQGETARQVKNNTLDPLTYHHHASKFHDALYAGSRNPFLEETARNLRIRVSAYHRQQLAHPGRINASHGEHEAIMQAVVEGSADLADEMTRQHVSIQGDMFIDYMTSMATEHLMAGS